MLDAQLTRLSAYLETDSDVAAMANQMVSSIEVFLADWLKTDLFPTVSKLMGSILSIGSAIVNLFMAIGVAVYLLLSREKYMAQCRKLFHAVSRNQNFNCVVEESLHRTHEIFGGFISGKLLDSLIIGVICYVGMRGAAGAASVGDKMAVPGGGKTIQD